MDLRDPLQRPPLAAWIWERSYTNREAAALFGVSHEQLRLWCLPFTNLARVAPRPEQRIKIAQVTAGAVAPESFDPPPPERNGRAAGGDPDVLRLARAD